jgi:predicted MFS family arabinose efflux permease
MQTTVYNLGIAAGSLTGGLILESTGAGGLPWVTLSLAVAALGTIIAARRHAFPAHRPAHGSDGGVQVQAGAQLAPPGGPF